MDLPIEQHYSREYLFENILANLERQGVERNAVTRASLAPMDEFHLRGLAATRELAEAAMLTAGMKVLDVGCGIGGPCRLLADEYGCIATGIDITREYIRTATLLSGLVGLQDRTHFIRASALNLPFPDDTFDMVWTQHVQMNIEDKRKFYTEIYRVLKPGGRFAYYDIFTLKKNDILFPVPWADTPALSFLITREEARNILTGLGLVPIQLTNQTQPAIQFLQEMLERMKTDNSKPVGLRLLIGALLPQKFQNLYRNLVEKRIELESGIYQKP